MERRNSNPENQLLTLTNLFLLQSKLKCAFYHFNEKKQVTCEIDTNQSSFKIYGEGYEFQFELSKDHKYYPCGIISCFNKKGECHLHTFRS